MEGREGEGGWEKEREREREREREKERHSVCKKRPPWKAERVWEKQPKIHLVNETVTKVVSKYL